MEVIKNNDSDKTKYTNLKILLPFPNTNGGVCTITLSYIADYYKNRGKNYM